MSTFSIFLVLITIVCFLLIIAIMVQNPKGGGLASTFGGSTQLGGVQKTTDFLDKSTWTLGAVLIVLIIASSLNFSGSSDNASKTLDENAPSPVPTTTTAPAAPKAQPDAAVPTPTEQPAK